MSKLFYINLVSWLISIFIVSGIISLIISFEWFALIFLIANFLAGSYVLKTAIKEVIENNSYEKKEKH